MITVKHPHAQAFHSGYFYGLCGFAFHKHVELKTSLLDLLEDLPGFGFTSFLQDEGLLGERSQTYSRFSGKRMFGRNKGNKFLLPTRLYAKLGRIFNLRNIRDDSKLDARLGNKLFDPATVFRFERNLNKRMNPFERR